MSNNNLATLIEDEHEIARDSDDLETLAGCFHDAATIHISWISGAAKDLLGKGYFFIKDSEF